MKYRILSVFGMLLFSFAFSSTAGVGKTIEARITEKLPVTPEAMESSDDKVAELYESFSLKNSTMPQIEVFEKAILGYTKLDEAGKVSNPLLTVIDFNLSSTKKRMWILNMDTREVVFNTFVAHGKNTGGEFAKNFSNKQNSHQSSLGFYVTGETYYGKNGLSLFIDGMEKEFNSNARARYVVIHGADYAEPSFIKRIGRLGRSYGCPAVPNKIAKDLIHKIKGKSVVYIHKNDENYLSKSDFLNV
ncbi:murein L,D-transpeptidase catalytic domain family protein [Christiangramia sabulilitoris]|uniref:Murein L,D-transpeptidase catalytic domain family protein n=1 Tax=Christiangramia sabulilitoris TaxID=2583991 RepID=A0A550HZ89_9FLAO|nr:murein L,D-transpeptidase catalytic domain family protein [Christiangramia sabulilitoris]TRO64025.1 murein L,D-transpeptidase catalytic domain family protein [Christiangramia sabulilitoris]